MGLESHVNKVLEEMGYRLGSDYYWSNGMRPQDMHIDDLVAALNESGQFGPARASRDKSGPLIRFTPPEKK